MKKCKILIIDDNAYELKSKKVQFFNCGYDVVVSNTTSAAKLELMQCDFDLVICDIMMPVTNGYEMVEYIRIKYPHIKVLTASCHTSGCDLVKPYKPQDAFNILQSIDNVIDCRGRFK